MWTAIHITDWLLWLFMAPSVIYVAFYAFISLFPSRPSALSHQPSAISHQPSTFLILFPAYKEDAVIVHSVRQCLEQTYPKEYYHIGVISDHMQDETNALLRQLPITLFTPQFEKSSKAKALHYAIEHSVIVVRRTATMMLPFWMASARKSTTLSSARHITPSVSLPPSSALVCALSTNGLKTMSVCLRQPSRIGRWRSN